MARDNTNQVLHKAFDLLEIVARYRGEWFTHEDITAKSGLPKTTTYRLLQFFVSRNILEQNEYKKSMYRHKRNR